MSGGRIGAVVQARTSSSRLPSKVVARLAGKPLLGYLLERLARAPSLDAIVVATSTDPADAAVARLCDERAVACHRGSLEDVVARLADTAKEHRLDAVVRVSGDSPLLDPAIVDRAVDLFREGGTDVVTNVFPRTFPRGQSVEVLGGGVLEALRAAPLDPEDREHVTPFVYRHAERFRVTSFTREEDASHVRLVVDTAEDLARMEALIAAMDRPHWAYSLDDLLRLGSSVG